MTNNNLTIAKDAKNDEFYTQLADIEVEMENYIDKFQNKVVFCNCDDPFESNFVKYFLMNFNRLGLKELIATGYRAKISNEDIPYILRISETKSYLTDSQSDLTVTNVDIFLQTKRCAVTVPAVGNMAHDEHGEPVQHMVKKVKQDLYYEAGDFRSDMSLALLEESDIVVTNPPFSLFRKFMAIMVQYDKKFIILGNMNAATYKEIFPLIKEDKLWYGPSISSGDRKFYVPDTYPLRASGCGVDDNGRKFIRVKGVRWFTNIDHTKRHNMLSLDTDYTYYGHEDMYPKYDNYDAINVDKVSHIPYDYHEAIGVPITFLDKYCPEQFEILNCNDFISSCDCDKKKTKSTCTHRRTDGNLAQAEICENAYPTESITTWLQDRLLMAKRYIDEYSLKSDNVYISMTVGMVDTPHS